MVESYDEIKRKEYGWNKWGNKLVVVRNSNARRHGLSERQDDNLA